MKGFSQILSLILVGILMADVCVAGSREVASPTRPSLRGTLYYKTAGSLTQMPNDLKPEDAVYRNLFAGSDDKIANLYRDQWWYHDQTVSSAANWKGDHISFASLDSHGRGAPEHTVREGFARQVFRMRIDQGIRDYLKRAEAPKAIARAQEAIDQVKNMPIRFSSAGGKAGEIRLGYDVISDSSKVEYVGGYLEAGFYQSEASGNLGKLNRGEFLVNTNIGQGIPKAAVKMPVNGETYEASLSHSLSPVVTASLSSQQPLNRADAPQQYYAQVAYNF